MLQGMRRVAWVKKQHKISLLPKQGEIMLENNTFRDFVFSAQFCKNCKMYALSAAEIGLSFALALPHLDKGQCLGTSINQ